MEKAIAMTEKLAILLVLEWLRQDKIYLDSYHTGGHALNDHQKRQGLIDPEAFDPIIPTEEQAMAQLSNCGGDHPLMTGAFAVSGASESLTLEQNDTSNCPASSINDLSFNLCEGGKEPNWRRLL